MKRLHLILVALVTCCYVHWIGEVGCTRSPRIKCQLVDSIVEQDPKDQHLYPLFYKKKKCAGGVMLNSGYQCQPKSTEKKYLKLHNTRKGKDEEKVIESATQCHEVCVCKRFDCGNVKTGICDKGFRWDKEKCRCICDTQSLGYSNKGKPDQVPIKFFFISFSLVFTMCFLSTAILVTICYLRYKRKKDKYSLLYRVEWNEEQKEKLEEYMDYVDGPGTASLFKKRWWQICCTQKGGKGEKAQLVSRNGNEDQVDNASIRAVSADKSAYECFNIGYIAFKRDKFDMMLEWMNEAERKWIQDNERKESNHTDENCYQVEEEYAGPVEILDERELYDYLALANFTAVAGNLESAKEYKRKALELGNKAKAGTNGSTQERRESDELNGNMQTVL